MNSIPWIVFLGCLVSQMHCNNYGIEIDFVRSNIPQINVTDDDPEKGDIKLTYNEERSGSTFMASVLKWNILEVGPVNGSVCETYEKGSDEAFITQIIYDGIGLESCPFPAGDYQVTRSLLRENETFDVLGENFGDATIRINVYNEGNDGAAEPDVLIWVSVEELTDKEVADFKNGGNNEDNEANENDNNENE